MQEYENHMGNTPEIAPAPDPLAWTKNPKWLNIRGITHDEVFHPEKCPHGRLERIIGGIRGSAHKGFSHPAIKSNRVTSAPLGKTLGGNTPSPSLVGFGKYAGLTIKELRQKDFRYLKWIAGENPKFKKKVEEALGEDWDGEGEELKGRTK